MTVYEVRWSIEVDEEWIVSGNKLFTNELGARRHEAELMAAVKLLQLDQYFGIHTHNHIVEG